ncbi:DNA mismatch repair endonuclease MutL [Lacticaseibacillus jixianensis]|uniref:DNA mismatch repair protein MutL n=1 Tax=Lacticaseibacillus jixianensis TaxID=2486012 RepID=A0ABW4B9K1_9LACO|nr:DNA mismatch repair endonuclease MutL [Lacticaseibacillus jixianensis]
MPKIHQLSTTLSNQIAAGEVIERPASVVKELVENAIDAGASQVDVTVAEAGLKTIKVVDNGSGIEPEDVPTAFLRHATSKIATTRDLFNVHSLGFRGEALASIAAVADVTLATATAAGLGTIAHIKGGQMLDQHSEGLRQGTQITVNDLFYNTPARLKYVQSQSTELNHILDIIDRLALGHPEIAFSLKNKDRVVIKTAGSRDLQQTIAGIYSVAVAKSMLAFQGEDNDFRVHGYMSLPDTTRSSRNYISLMINGRYIKNFQLMKAFIAGYGSKLMVGRYPLAVIAVEMDPLLVDVNVHPTKQEVRLSKEDQLGALLTETIRTRLGQENLIPDALHNLRQHRPVDMDQLTIALNQASRAMPDPPSAPSMVGEQQAPAARPLPSAPAQAAGHAAQASGAEADTGLSISDLDDRPIFDEPDRLAAWDAKYQRPALTETPVPPTLVAAAPPKERFPSELRYLAQVHGTYLLAEAPDGLYMLDQHAAQERVNYERLRREIGEVASDEQALLVPITLDYPASDAVAIRAKRAVLEGVGIFLEDFGQNTFVVRQHPTWFKKGEEEATIRAIIDWVLDEGHVTVAAFREKTAIMMSCKQAIKANHHIDRPQAEALLKNLAQCENPFNCPHGRPTLVHFSNTDLEKMFKRIQDSHQSFGGAK